MSPLSDAGKRSRRPLRIAVIAAALGVAGCFTAAFTFADGPAQASETSQTR
jgi:hypothetical protein